MRLEQISVFVENTQGILADITTGLGNAGVNIQAFAVFDTPEFGILRMIVDKPEEALEQLKQENYVASKQTILGANLQNVPGNLGKVLTALHEAGLTIEYLYTIMFTDDGHPMLLFSTDDNEAAAKVLKELQA